MTTPIRITTKQTNELHRKWQLANKANRILTLVAASLWMTTALLRTLDGFARPDDWLNWLNIGLAFLAAISLFLSVYFPRLFSPSMITTATFTGADMTICMDKNGKARRYSVGWDKVYVHESADCFFIQVNWRQMQIFRKADLTDCTAEELSAFLCSKIGKRYGKL